MRVKEVEVHFDINRVHKRNLIAKNILILAFTLVTFVLLMYIPFISYQQEIIALESANNNLSNQLYLIQSEHSAQDTTSLMEINYSDAYSYLMNQKTKTYQYIQDVLTVSENYVIISSYTLDSSLKKITFAFSGATEIEINEFMISVFENYGISLVDPSESRWIVSAPVRVNVTSLKVEVSFYYA